MALFKIPATSPYSRRRRLDGKIGKESFWTLFLFYSIKKNKRTTPVTLVTKKPYTYLLPLKSKGVTKELKNI